MRAIIAAAVLISLAGVDSALAWGDEGHEVTALIAYRHLTPKAKARLHQLLASDPDTLTAPDFASRATWADRYRTGHRETAPWHFVDLELDHPSFETACFGFPPTPAGQPASAGPSQDCVVDKISQFRAELHDPATAPAERLLALKFLIHFIGDVHQPLHAADNADKGANCIALEPSPGGRARNLHAYWDTTVVGDLGASASDIAARLDANISASDVVTWRRIDPKSWARESFGLARRDAYNLPNRPTCASPGSVALSPAYQAAALADAAHQLSAAGIRMAVVLNDALDH